MYSETYQVTVADLGYYEKEKQIEILVNELRDKMLKMAWGIKCNAARINAVQSGMMTNQDVVYLVELGKQARNEDVHGFWDYCEMERYVYTAEQEAFRKKWFDSLKNQ